MWCWWYSTYLGGGGGASGVGGGIPHTTTLTLSDLQPNLVGAQVEFNLTQYHRRLELLEKSLRIWFKINCLDAVWGYHGIPTVVS